MNKNPFSIYDFLGYLFPGLVVLLTVVYVYYSECDSINCLFSVRNFEKVFTEELLFAKWQSTAILIVLSYIAGHIIAYLSSVIVEKFSVTLFKYPSIFLLHSDDSESEEISRLRDFRRLFCRYFRFTRNFGSKFWRVVVFFILLPVSVPMLLGVLLSLNQFIVRPLDEYVRNSILGKLNRLAEKLQITPPDVNSEEDFHRIVMHYVYINIPNCQRKTDNYVAMYGFLRAMTLIACLLFDYYFVKMVAISIIAAFSDVIEVSFDLYALINFILLSVICNILFMGFVKYYRRFTLENLMTLLTEKES